MAMIYPSEILNNMIHEVEKAFPLETPVFPTSSSSKLNKRLGTRHRAAVGITEETDCIALVVSEETGRMSIAIKGELFYNLTIDDVRMMLIDELRPKQDSLQDEDDYEDEEEIYEEDN